MVISTLTFAGPDTFPANVTGFNRSSTSLFLEWKHIPPQHRYGILQGYKISYFSNSSYETVLHQTVHGSRTSTTLENLKKFTWYVIRVAGYTSKGLGPSPLQPLVIRTSEDGKSRDSFYLTSLSVLCVSSPYFLF